MSELARFYGLIVKMFFRQSEHNPPHIHVEYGENVGVFDIQTFDMMEGDLPKRAIDLVKEWGLLHKDELMQIWDTQNFVKIAPLD